MKKVIKNHPEVAILPTITEDKHPLRSKYTAKKYWKGIVEDLIEVNSILSEEVTST